MRAIVAVIVAAGRRLPTHARSRRRVHRLDPQAEGDCSGPSVLQRRPQLLRSGFKPDLVVLRGSPDRDVTAIRAVDRVMVAGRWVDTSKDREY